MLLCRDEVEKTWLPVLWPAIAMLRIRAGSGHCGALYKPLNAGPFSTKNFLCVNCMYSTSTIYLCILVHVYLHAGIHTFFGKFAL